MCTDNKFRAIGRIAVDSDAASVRFDDLLHKVQPETGSVDLIVDRALPAKERIEDMGLFEPRPPFSPPKCE
jgi:hypothetical protein